jgi:dTDP-4-amino-4,6-dideoxygalactose transaminase
MSRSSDDAVHSEQGDEMKTNTELAINGGPKLLARGLPPRRLFGEAELQRVRDVFENSWETGIDFGFQGKYEEAYTTEFCRYQGCGYADAVSSGTAAVFLALKALNIDPGTDIIVSPVTDPGGVMPVLMLGMNLVLADAEPGSYNTGPEEFEKALTANTRAAIITHAGGHPVQMDEILEIASSRGVKIIEDCSQAHGALSGGKKVGCFGDLAVFSTMFSKTHATGGCGGIVFTTSEEYYWRVRSLADRGKPFHQKKFNPKNPIDFLWPSLNFNQDEVSCAIGSATLAKLPQTIQRRNRIAKKLDAALSASCLVSPCTHRYDGTPSPFFHTVAVDIDKLTSSKKVFAETIAAEGVWINPDYRYVVSEWDWVKRVMPACTSTPNATRFREETFNILFNERFSERDIKTIVRCILKVEACFTKCV